MPLRLWQKQQCKNLNKVLYSQWWWTIFKDSKIKVLYIYWTVWLSMVVLTFTYFPSRLLLIGPFRAAMDLTHPIPSILLFLYGLLRFLLPGRFCFSNLSSLYALSLPCTCPHHLSHASLTLSPKHLSWTVLLTCF